MYNSDIFPELDILLPERMMLLPTTVHTVRMYPGSTFQDDVITATYQYIINPLHHTLNKH